MAARGYLKAKKLEMAALGKDVESAVKSKGGVYDFLVDGEQECLSLCL